MAHDHRNPRTGLSCNCQWGRPIKRGRTASQNVRKIRNQNQKAFRDEHGQAFLHQLEELIKTHPDSEPLVPWLAARYKKGEINLNDKYGDTRALTITHDDTPLTYRLPLWTQWHHARQHPLRQGVDINQHDTQSLTDVARELQIDVQQRQKKQNWLISHGPDSNYPSKPVHVFGPDDADDLSDDLYSDAFDGSEEDPQRQEDRDLLHKYQGWSVHPISDADEAEAETDALGHCIGQDSQPYKGAIDAGEISAHSLRDKEGFPKVSWHHNDHTDGSLAHLQGASGDPKDDYRRLISLFHHKHELDDADGFGGDDHADQLQHGEQYDYGWTGPPVEDLEDFHHYYGDDGFNNLYEHAVNNGANFDPDGYDLELEPGSLDWQGIAKDAEKQVGSAQPWLHNRHEHGYNPEHGVSDDHEEVHEMLTGNYSHYRPRYVKELVGPEHVGVVDDHGGISDYDWLEQFHKDPTIVAHPNALAAWLDHNNELNHEGSQYFQDEEPAWVPPDDPRRQQQEIGEFPQQPPQNVYGPQLPQIPGQGQLVPNYQDSMESEAYPSGQPYRTWGDKSREFAWDNHWTTKTANILDPIHDKLDSTVFDDPEDPTPVLKTKHDKWITNIINRVLLEAGYDGMDKWLTLIFTGSLTTYQYSADSDVDVSVFVDAEQFPEWSRAEMIGVMVEHIDGTKLPGTTHPMQCFVVPPDVSPDDLYKPGLRSGYNITEDYWIVPPEKERVHDVEAEMNSAYVHALLAADKMEALLAHEPERAVKFWHQIHRRRQRDQRAGKGDYSDSNIVYKMLANRDLFPKISEVSGEYIAKTGVGPAQPTQWAWEQQPPQEVKLPQGTCPYCGSTQGPGDTTCPQCGRPAAQAQPTQWQGFPDQLANPQQPVAKVAQAERKWTIDKLAVKRLADSLGVKKPIVVEQIEGTTGRYLERPGFHYVGVVWWLSPEAAERQIRHEVRHAFQTETQGSLPERPTGFEDYRAMPTEEDARSWAEETGEPLVHVARPMDKQLRKFVYGNGRLIIGELGREEGEHPSHFELEQQLGVPADESGVISENGWISFEGPPSIEHKPQGNMWKMRAEIEQQIRAQIPDIQGVLGGSALEPAGWSDWES